MTNDAVDKVNELLKVSFFSKKLKDKFVELAGLLENRRYDDALNLIEQDEENGKVFLELGTPGLERLKRGIRELKGEGVADWPREKGPLTITLDVWPAKAKFYPGVIVGTNVQLEYEIKGRPPFHSYGYCYENDIWKKISELKRKLDLNWGNLDFDIGRKITGPGKYNFNMVAADSKKVREGSASIPFYLYEIKVEITEAAGLPVLKDAGPWTQKKSVKVPYANQPIRISGIMRGFDDKSFQWNFFSAQGRNAIDSGNINVLDIQKLKVFEFELYRPFEPGNYYLTVFWQLPNGSQKEERVDIEVLEPEIAVELGALNDSELSIMVNGPEIFKECFVALRIWNEAGDVVFETNYKIDSNARYKVNIFKDEKMKTASGAHKIALTARPLVEGKPYRNIESSKELVVEIAEGRITKK
ncbi:hypothetical protein HY637_00625 [Candidatus Woesearchaeota archaeon]|nr:hypothetical protein [Candidatus Woesearchaeota archaeon]